MESDFRSRKVVKIQSPSLPNGWFHRETQRCYWKLSKSRANSSAIINTLSFDNVDKDCQGLIMPQREIEKCSGFFEVNLL